MTLTYDREVFASGTSRVVVYFEEDATAYQALCRTSRVTPVSWTASMAPMPYWVVLASSEATLVQNRERLCQQHLLRIVALSDQRFTDPYLDSLVFAYLPVGIPVGLLEHAIGNAVRDIEHRHAHRDFASRLLRAFHEIDELNGIGAALSAEHDVPKLLETILSKSRQIAGADAGSLYLVESEDADMPGMPSSARKMAPCRYLRFVQAQNDSVPVSFRESVMEINSSSIAGYVALTGESVSLDDAYYPPPGVPYSINRAFDRESGYRTKSILAVPMRNPKGEIVGVVQLINAKRSPNSRLDSVAATNAEVVPFRERHRDLLVSLASQAAVAVENSRLVAAIERLFEAFVRAAVVAIEGRDPTTCGHSFRVAGLTLALAEAVNREIEGPLANVFFQSEQMKEIRYAALLHDFGKLGVREEILVKANKLFPQQLEVIRQRFTLIKRTQEADNLRERLAFLLEHGPERYAREAPQFDTRLRRLWEELDFFWEFVQKANRPTVNPAGEFQLLADIASRSYPGPDGMFCPLLTPEEVRQLSIRKGSLDAAERAQIESHVIHSHKFLSQIPWTAAVRGVPTIALTHHEKLNGAGYPHGLTSPDIPLQARMMAIADIFDGLTSCDRPYKKAVASDLAIEIMEGEVNRGELDPDLFDIFVKNRVWEHSVAL